MSKQPTPQGISALLRKAGFSRSETSTTAVPGWHHYSPGYRVRGNGPGEVHVWHEDGRLRPTDEDRQRAAENAGWYAEAIEAAGYAVERRDGLGMFGAMRVTAGED